MIESAIVAIFGPVMAWFIVVPLGATIATWGVGYGIVFLRGVWNNQEAADTDRRWQMSRAHSAQDEADRRARHGTV